MAATSTPSSDYGDYLRRHLSPVLVGGLAELAKHRPKDPIEFLAKYLQKYGAQNIPEKGLVAESNYEKHSSVDEACLLEDEEPLVTTLDMNLEKVHKDCVQIFVEIGDLFDDTDLV